MSEFVIKPIGRIRTPYGQKFAVPRQPGLAPAACEIELFKPYCDPQAVVGLEGFSHLHVIFVFDQEPEQDTFRPMVRPPRLGGNQRVGVFVCRSPNRPNRLGLSVLKLNQIENRNGRIVLHVEGADMVDNTPIIDIKPYIPFVDAIPEAQGGFAQQPPVQKQVVFSPKAQEQLAEPTWGHLNEQRALLESILAQDPRPAYKQKEADGKDYAALILGVNVRFSVNTDTVTVLNFEAPPQD